jgi:hypothetical protein
MYQSEPTFQNKMDTFYISIQSLSWDVKYCYFETCKEYGWMLVDGLILGLFKDDVPIKEVRYVMIIK